MMWEQIIGLILALLLMAVATVGSLIPGIPGSPFVLVAAVLHRLYFHDRGAATWVLIVMTGMVLFSLVVDYLASLYGAKKMGATWRGLVGAMVGALVGMFFSIPGIIIGTFLGALTFELIGGRGRKDAMKAGLGATLGLLAGAVGKVACCVAMTGLFAMNVIYRTWMM